MNWRITIKDAFDARIRQQLAALGAAQDPAVLRNETDYAAIYNLQTLLSIGGYQPGGLDGIVGSRTLGAVNRFRTQDIAPDGPPARADQSSANRPAIPRTSGTVVSQGVTKLYDGENGYGVSNLAIEKAWSRITGEKIPEPYDDGRYYYAGSAAPADNARPLIVIDLGHGADIGYVTLDSGAVSQTGLSEVDVVDPVSLAMAERLYAQGYQVAFTRNPGEQLRVEGTHGQTLRVRPDFAHALADEIGANGVIFVSMHANSFKQDSRANGGRIYVDVDGARIANANSGELGRSLAKNFTIASKSSSVRHIGNLCVIDRFENKVTDAKSAAVLVELGFLSNDKDLAALAHMRDHPEKAASQIVAGIEDHVKSTTPGLKDPADTIRIARSPADSGPGNG